MALSHYEQAIGICQMHGLRKKEADIHCTLVELLILKDTHQAMKEAEHAISINPLYERVRCINELILPESL